jgi:hypothetical protein
MTLRAIVIMPEGTYGAEPGKPYLISADTHLGLARGVGINYWERVNPPAGRAAGFTCLMDDDAMTRGLTINPIAQRVMAYPTSYNIRGPVAFLSETDDGDGPHFISLQSGPKAWILGALGLYHGMELEELPKFKLRILPEAEREVPRFQLTRFNGTWDEVRKHLGDNL